MYAITGATGNTGSVVAERLLEAGQKVRVLGRDPNRLKKFTEKGAESFIADATNAGALTNAFAGASAVYTMIPPNIGAPDVRSYMESVSGALCSAILKNGIKYAVVLSSVGADKSYGTGPVTGLHNLEKKLEGTPGLNALFLRAGYFMENLLPQAGVIRSMGIMTGPVRGDLPLPMIATRDIGAFAAEALVEIGFRRKGRARTGRGSRCHLRGSCEDRRRGNWQARPRIHARARGTAKARADADGDVVQHGRPVAGDGCRPEFGPYEDA